MPTVEPYFAYGSNLDPVQMQRRCPGSRAVETATVAGFALTFPVHSGGDWAGGVASIEQQPDAVVQGVIYEVTESDLTALDHYEAIAEGMYVRGRVAAVTTKGENIDAITYFAVRGYNAPDAPSRKYMAAIIRGAEHHGLSPDYIDTLRQIKTND